jgi:hypothetical protein
MALTRTRAELRNDARALADQDDSDFITDAQANHWINQELGELVDMIVAVDPAAWMSTSSISAVAGTFLYTLPADFYQILMVERVDGTNEATTLDPFTLNAKNERGNGSPLDDLPDWGPSTRYMVRGSGVDGTGARLWLYPDPGTKTYTLYYVTAPPSIDTAVGGDTQAIDGRAGWLDWVVYGVAIRMKERAEEDANGLRMDRQRIQARIEHMAAQRDAGRPVLPTTTRRNYDDFPRAR